MNIGIKFYVVGSFPFHPRIGIKMTFLPTKPLEWKSPISIPIPDPHSPQPNTPVAKILEIYANINMRPRVRWWEKVQYNYIM